MTDENPDEPIGPSVRGELADAVDDALEPELKRARARFVQAFMGLDRGEGVGRGEERWDVDSYRRLGLDGPDDPTGDSTA